MADVDDALGVPVLGVLSVVDLVVEAEGVGVVESKFELFTFVVVFVNALLLISSGDSDGDNEDDRELADDVDEWGDEDGTDEGLVLLGLTLFV